MAVKLSFDDLSARVEDAYPGLELDFGGSVLLFANPMRQERSWREGFADLYEALIAPDGNVEGEDGAAKDRVLGYRELLAYACVSGEFAVLVERLGEDPALWTELFVAYAEAVSPGEASPSDAS